MPDSLSGFYFAKTMFMLLLGYKEGEINEDSNATIIIKNKGTELSQQGKYPSQEPFTLIPYVVDLLSIRGNKQKDYS